MKALFSKATMAAAVACMALASAPNAKAEWCSNESLKGKYGQTVSGQILAGPTGTMPQNGVAMTDFDGNGKFTQVDYVVIGGVPQSAGFQKETGTYQVNSDCTGTATINEPDGSVINLALVVVNRGIEFRTVVTSLLLGGHPVPANIGSNGVRVNNEY
jgi:hypothetical protein